MAVGWAKDGAVKEQIEAAVADALEVSRRNSFSGEIAFFVKNMTG